MGEKHFAEALACERLWKPSDHHMCLLMCCRDSYTLNFLPYC